jgi:hypothetical protein
MASDADGMTTNRALLYTPIESLGFSDPLVRGVKNYRILTAAQLVSRTRRSISMMYHVGRCKMDEVDAGLVANGLRFHEANKPRVGWARQLILARTSSLAARKGLVASRELKTAVTKWMNDSAAVYLCDAILFVQHQQDSLFWDDGGHHHLVDEVAGLMMSVRDEMPLSGLQPEVLMRLSSAQRRLAEDIALVGQLGDIIDQRVLDPRLERLIKDVAESSQLLREEFGRLVGTQSATPEPLGLGL